MAQAQGMGRRYIKAFFKGFFVAVPVTVTFLDRVACVARVEGASMQPSLNPGERQVSDVVLLNHWSIRNYEVQRGDIVSLVYEARLAAAAVVASCWLGSWNSCCPGPLWNSMIAAAAAFIAPLQAAASLQSSTAAASEVASSLQDWLCVPLTAPPLCIVVNHVAGVNPSSSCPLQKRLYSLQWHSTLPRGEEVKYVVGESPLRSSDSIFPVDHAGFLQQTLSRMENTGTVGSVFMRCGHDAEKDPDGSGEKLTVLHVGMNDTAIFPLEWIKDDYTWLGKMLKEVNTSRP
ncbi:Mitochondrial inner membrane protease subunit 2 [Chelonia mydas]|uniref:Mitochondrial inner membrane protease subunit 2 n=1 Tax=Chelonia mydas TaxID=8469 RepID=M7AL90_CHEMY|nr:Mitochondrial inner membrane protease subunit 2 [Chelonia mydas]